MCTVLKQVLTILVFLQVHKFFITTHGFLSFSPRLHNLMYKTQYIAPLRVKLDPSRSENSTINYLLRDNRWPFLLCL